MLHHGLSLEQRSLNSEQMRKAVTALQACPVPLYIQLLMKQLKDWKSFSILTQPLPTSIDGITHTNKILTPMYVNCMCC